MSTTAVAQRLKSEWETPRSLWGALATVDHKEIGIRYIVTALLFMCIGGIEALLVRVQLARPDQALMSPEMYDQLFTMHGITMIFWYAQPILSGFAIYVIPMMIGARDMALPRLNAFTYWAFLLSGILVYIAPFMGQAPHGGWFAYVPYTGYQYSPSHGMDFYAMSLLLFTISMTGGAVNFILTIMRQRAPGMAINRMPLFVYSTFTISWVSIFAMPALSVACVFLELDRRWGTHFYTIAKGGSAILWQQLFWFFGHPWVYIVFLPATGMLSMIIPVFSRRPIVGYPWVAVSTILTGAVGFSVWLHHMFTVGMSDMAMSFFSAGSMMISIFTTIQIFAWVATLWKGRLVMTTAMHYALGAIAILIVGGLNGIVTGIIPLDWQAHNTYFVVSHIHYVLIGGNMFPVFAGLYYWFPKMTGRMLNEPLGKLSFWIAFVGFNVAFFPMQIVGLAGMPRRIYTYPAGLGWGAMNMLETVGAFVLGIGLLLTFINLIVSRKSGRVAGKNPWNADTLEWATDSPPEAYAFVHIPTVASRHPLWDDHDEESDPADERTFEEGRLTPVSTWLDAEPYAVAKMPGETLVPLFACLTLFGFFLALVFQLMWVVLGCFIATLLLAFFWLWPRPETEGAA
jgi:cytochrome c oxidase subunit 1/cytochrome c oxidase subunit I+III